MAKVYGFRGNKLEITNCRPLEMNESLLYSLSFRGSLFHSLGSETEKAKSP